MARRARIRLFCTYLGEGFSKCPEFEIRQSLADFDARPANNAPTFFFFPASRHGELNSNLASCKI